MPKTTRTVKTTETETLLILRVAPSTDRTGSDRTVSLVDVAGIADFSLRESFEEIDREGRSTGARNGKVGD